MPKEAKLYVGNIPDSATNEDITDLFKQFGSLSYVDFKHGKTARFAFVEYRNYRDAKTAVTKLHETDYRGRCLKVELPIGVGPRGRGGKPLSDINDNHTRVTRGPGGPQRRTDFRVFIDGIPQTGSWQDLKDYFRQAGEVCFAMVNRNKTGIVEFEEKSSVQKSIDMLDKTEFVSHFDEAGIIRVSDYSSIKNRENFRSRFCSKSRSRTGSPSLSRSPSRSCSRSSSYSRSSPLSSPGSHSPHFRTRTPSESTTCSLSPKRPSSHELLQSHCRISSKRRRRSRSSSQSS